MNSREASTTSEEEETSSARTTRTHLVTPFPTRGLDHQDEYDFNRPKPNEQLVYQGY